MKNADITPSYFAGKYAISDDGCWNWLHCISHLGYGRMRVKMDNDWKTAGAHRVSWMAHRGAIPNGLHVLHKCDNRRCVNPDHLFLGTHLDNMADCKAKGRKARLYGEDNPDSRLTNAQVIQIKQMLSEGVMQRLIAEKFGVSQNMISHIKLGHSWTHILEKQNG